MILEQCKLVFSVRHVTMCSVCLSGCLSVCLSIVTSYTDEIPAHHYTPGLQLTAEAHSVITH